MKRIMTWSIGTAIAIGLVTFGIHQYRQKKYYEIVNLKRGQIKEAIYGLGTVVSDRIYEHKLGVVSAIRKLHVKVGDRVKKGQVLMSFDETSPLVAPIEGTITHLPFHEGENVFPQVAVVRIEDLSSRVVEVGLEQIGALRVRLGQKVRMSFESLREKYYEGTVESLYPSAGQFVVRIKPLELPAEILPAMTVDVAIEVADKNDALLAPASAIQNGRITVIDNNQKAKKAVQIGLADGEWVELLDPSLNEQTKVIVPRN